MPRQDPTEYDVNFHRACDDVTQDDGEPGCCDGCDKELKAGDEYWYTVMQQSDGHQELRYVEKEVDDRCGLFCIRCVEDKQMDVKSIMKTRNRRGGREDYIYWKKFIHVPTAHTVSSSNPYLVDFW